MFPHGVAGVNSLLWDEKAQAGGSVGRGVYFVEIVAQDEEGHSARTVRAVVVR